MEEQEESEEEEESDEEEEEDSEEEQSEEEEKERLKKLFLFCFNVKGNMLKVKTNFFLSFYPYFSVSRKVAVKLPPQSTKGGRSNGKSKQAESGHSTTRSQQSTPKQSQSANKGGSKNSGKKATPVSNGKPQPRAGSRSSARLSLEVISNGTATKSSSQSSPAAQNTDSRKRPITGKNCLVKKWRNIKDKI